MQDLIGTWQSMNSDGNLEAFREIVIGTSADVVSVTLKVPLHTEKLEGLKLRVSADVCSLESADGTRYFEFRMESAGYLSIVQVPGLELKGPYGQVLAPGAKPMMLPVGMKFRKTSL